MFWHVPMESPKMPKRRGEPEGSPHTRGGGILPCPPTGMAFVTTGARSSVQPAPTGAAGATAHYRTLPHTAMGAPKTRKRLEDRDRSQQVQRAADNAAEALHSAGVTPALNSLSA